MSISSKKDVNADNTQPTKASESLASQSSVNERFRMLLSSISQCDSNSSNFTSKNSSTIGKQLSQLLLTKNGLIGFLIACDDLGGNSFWQNSAAISTVVKILVTKPAHVKSAPKYHAFILYNLFLAFKSSTFSNRIGLLFAYAVEEFQRVAPLCVRTTIVDRILLPFEVVLERGNLAAPNADDPAYRRRLWTRQLDEALWITVRWFKFTTATGPFAAHEAFLQMLPFWLHLLGQVEALNAHLAAEAVGTSNGKHVDTRLSAFADDLRAVCRRLIDCLPSPTEQANFLLNKILFCNDWKRQAYFELNLLDDFPASKISPKIQVLNEEEDGESSNSGDFRFNYASLKLSVRDEPFSLQDFVDFKFFALEPLILHMPSNTSCRLLTSILSAAFEQCRASNPSKRDRDSHALNQEDFRFVSFDEQFVCKHLDEDTLFLPHYVLSNFLKIFSNFNFDNIEKLDEAVYLELVQLTEKIDGTFKEEFNNTNLTTSKVSILRSEASKAVNNGSRLDAFLATMNVNNDTSDASLSVASCGAALVEVAKALRRRDTTLFANGLSDFERLYVKIIENVNDTDTFIFLAAINTLSELAYWKTDIYLPRMIDMFLKWSAPTFLIDSNEDDDCKNIKSKSEMTFKSTRELKVNNNKNITLIFKGKIGEAIAKVARQLGDLSPVYFDRISDALLSSLRNNADDEILRCSALSALADLIHACRGVYFDKILHELLLCISQIIKTKSSTSLERRGAIHLLRSMLQSANSRHNGNIFEVFVDSLTSVATQLKYLWRNDSDEVVRLHAELALIEIEEAVASFFNYDNSNTIAPTRRLLNLKLN